MKDGSPLVSCVCVTRNRVHVLKRAIGCFLAQSYPNKELIIQYESDDSSTPSLREAYAAHPEIKWHQVDDKPKLTLGERRNLSIERSSGEYFCQWDDDDWYHADRIRDQLSAVLSTHQSASIMTNRLIFDASKRTAYFSHLRLWESSILCRRDALTADVRYPARNRMEDTYFTKALVENNRVYPHVLPTHYIYVINHGNISPQSHFDLLLAASQPLSPALSRLVADILDGTYSPETASRILTSSDVLHEIKYFFVNNITGTTEQLKKFEELIGEGPSPV